MRSPIEFLVSIVAYFVTVFLWAITWSIVLFRERYEALAGDFLREPPLYASGIASILLQALAVTVAFAFVYPKGQFRLLLALGITAAVNTGAVTYGSFVIPGKFNIPDVASWISLELSYGVIATCLITTSLAAVWSRFPQSQADAGW